MELNEQSMKEYAPKENETSKFISTLTEFIPTFFSSKGVLSKDEDETLMNINDVLEQSEMFFQEHPNSFPSDIYKNTFVINKLQGVAKKWGLSLKTDNILESLSYKKFKHLLIKNFGDTKEQKYALIEQLLELKQKHLGKATFYTIEFRRLSRRIGWQDNVLIDLIRRGLIDEVKEEFDKVKNKPQTLFEATNMIIEIDKRCLLNNKITNSHINKFNKKSTFRMKRHELNKNDKKAYNHFKHNELRSKKKNLLSANFTPSFTGKMTNTFTISFNNKPLKIKLMIDSGSARSFICKDFVTANKIPVSGLPSPINIQLPNNKNMNIKQTTKSLQLQFMDHKENFEFCVANLQLHGISEILGRDWLNIHKPYINFENNYIYFLEKFCSDHCPSSKGNKFMFHSKEITASMVPEAILTNDSIFSESNVEEDISDGDLCAVMVDNIKQQTMEEKEEITNKYYLEFKIVFEKQQADKLPKHRKYDMSIELIPGSQLYYGPIYSLTAKELKALKEYIKENLKKGFIRKSKSPAGAPVLFVMKRDGTLRLCVDYRKLNAITIRNSYPIPRISDLIECFKGAIIFTRLDLRSAYNLIRIKEGQEYLTAFRTPLGHYEYLVMPFGLRNAPSVFQRFVQDIFSEVIGKFVQVYLDDIIIYSSNNTSHIDHVKTVLNLLISNGLYAKLEKCDFHVKSTTFLGFTVSSTGLIMDASKLNSILEWPTPTNIKDLQSFLGLCNYYRKFIKNFAKIMEPLRNLLKKNVTFIWDESKDEAFNKLKSAFKDNEFLIFPDPEKEFILETDASDYAVGCVQSQIYDKDKLLHPIAFHSRALNKNEINYTIYDKELLAIIVAFETWRHHLEGAKYPVRIITDHKNLLYFRKP